MSTDLKSCPFCGGEAHLSNWTDQAYVWCECGVKTEVYLHSGCVDKAIEAWNRRAERTVKPKKGAYDLIRCDCGMPVSSNYDFCPKCKAKLDWSVENCQPENGDDFENANRKGNDE